MAEITPTRRKLLLATLGGAALVMTACTEVPTTQDSAVPQCDSADLPPEAYDTATIIDAGGPYPYPDNDNRRFGNYEGILPDKELGYYREYTVDTPGLHHRGERRIVTGGGTSSDPEVWYYTDDHYDSFCELPDAF